MFNKFSSKKEFTPENYAAFCEKQLIVFQRSLAKQLERMDILSTSSIAQIVYSEMTAFALFASDYAYCMVSHNNLANREKIQSLLIDQFMNISRFQAVPYNPRILKKRFFLYRYEEYGQVVCDDGYFGLSIFKNMDEKQWLALQSTPMHRAVLLFADVVNDVLKNRTMSKRELSHFISKDMPEIVIDGVFASSYYFILSKRLIEAASNYSKSILDYLQKDELPENQSEFSTTETLKSFVMVLVWIVAFLVPAVPLIVLDIPWWGMVIYFVLCLLQLSAYLNPITFIWAFISEIQRPKYDAWSIVFFVSFALYAAYFLFNVIIPFILACKRSND